MKKKKRCMALAAALTMSLALSSTALAATPTDIGGHWAQGTIIQWTSKGYISGYPDGTFKPDNSITRAEFVRLVNEAMGYTKTGNTYFSDVSSSYWGYNDIQKGVAAGYVRGDGNGKFRPDDPVSRQEAAVMIAQICGLGQDFAAAAKYNDYRYIASWAAGYVGAVSDAGIMSGYPDGDFKADRYLSRAEAVIALDKSLSYNVTDDREVLDDYKLTSTSLKDKIIKGDLVISSSLSNKDVVLDNVKVEGTVIVEGGNKIIARDCEINKLQMNDKGTTFSAEGKTTVSKTTFEKYGTLEGSGYSQVVIDNDFDDYVVLDAKIKEVELDEETNVKLLENCVIDSFTATKNADKATINFNKAEVEDMYLYDAVRITGRGEIINMTVYESGVKSSIKPEDLTTKDGASKPEYTTSSSGDITWGGGSSSRYDDLTASKDKTYSGGKYDDVKVTADGGVKLKNMTIYGDLIIDEDVENGSVDLEDVTVKGNVYIEGGKDSITFEDCDIEGNIYSRKSYKNDPVTIRFDKYTASHIDGTLVISENGAVIKETESGAFIDNIEVKTSDKVEIGTDVKKLDVLTKTDNLTINSGSEVTKLTVSSSAKNSKITINGKVKELNTNVDITVSGSGTVDKTTGKGDVTFSKAVTGVKLDKTEAEMKVGDTLKLTATVEPSDAAHKEVNWKSSDTSVATVDAEGNVKAVKNGTATITVTTEDGGKTAECKITVKDDVQEVKVTSITINGSANMTVNGEQTLTAAVKPDNATNKDVTWSSSDIEVAKVDQDTGKVTALKEGNVTITATAKDGSGVKDTFDIAVKKSEVPVTGIEITSDTGSFEVQLGASLKLTAKVSPDDATDKGVTWSSSNKSVATMNQDGTVNVLNPGKTTIRATANDGSGIYAEKEIEVTKAVNPVTGITITGADEVKLGETLQLTATVTPDEATNKDLIWSSSNKDVATVDQNGLVTTKTAGTTTITAKAKDGSDVEGTKDIRVTKPTNAITDITITGDDKVELGKTLQLGATITPDEATNKDLIWSSSNKDVATVDQNGLVTTKGPGKTTITAASKDGSEVKGTKEIEVVAPEKAVEKIEITGGNTVKLGEELKLTAVITPDDAANKEVVWSSSDKSVATMNQDGTVNTKKAGTTTITATAKDGSGVSADIEITVTSPTNAITDITITGANTVKIGEELKLTAVITPDNATKKDIIWSSSNKDVATMNQDGTVNIKKVGTTTITAASQDGSGIKGTMQLTVVENDAVTVDSYKAELSNLLNQYAQLDPASQTGAYITKLTAIEKPEDANALAAGTKYIEKANVQNFNTAINEAYKVLNTSSDPAALQKAIADFNTAVNTYVKTKA